MDDENSKRKAKRVDLSFEIKVRFADQADFTTVVIKDISASGLKVVVAGKLIKVDDLFDLKMRIEDSDIECKGRVMWVAMRNLGLGGINIFDVGIRFCELSAENRETLKKLTGE